MKRRNLAILIKSTYILAITFIALIGLTLAQYSWSTAWTTDTSTPTQDGNTIQAQHFTDLKNAIDGIYNAITIQDNQPLATYTITDTSPEEILATKGYVDSKPELKQDECEWVDAHCMQGHSCPNAAEYIGICQVGYYSAGMKLSTWSHLGTYNHQIYCCKAE